MDRPRRPLSLREDPPAEGFPVDRPEPGLELRLRDPLGTPPPLPDPFGGAEASPSPRVPPQGPRTGTLPAPPPPTWSYPEPLGETPQPDAGRVRPTHPPTAPHRAGSSYRVQVPGANPGRRTGGTGNAGRLSGRFSGRLSGRLSAWLEAVAESCRGRSAPARALVWLGLAWVGLRQGLDPDFGGPFGGINFGVHELGHVVFGGFGRFLEVAGGTILELSVPIAAGVVLARQRDAFGVTFTLAWYSTALHGVARYLGDARARSLPLLGLGSGEPQHDWAYLLGRLGMLESDRTLAGLLRLASTGCMLLALGAGAWLIVQMVRRTDQYGVSHFHPPNAPRGGDESD